MQMYHRCLEAAERRQDAQATCYFAGRLAECYHQMKLPQKAAHFGALARVQKPGPPRNL